MAAGVPGVGRMGVVVMQLVVGMVAGSVVAGGVTAGGVGMVASSTAGIATGRVVAFHVAMGDPSVVSFRIHTHPLLLDRLGAEKRA